MTDISAEAKACLAELRANQIFHRLMKELRALSRPVVPGYRPGSTEEIAMLVEKIKYETGRQEGFDLIYLYLTGERNG